MTQSQRHIPVMLAEVLSLLDPQPGQTIIDVTCGCGGYADAIRLRLQGQGLLVACDRDPEMARCTRERLAAQTGAPFRVFQARFSQLKDVLAEAGLTRVDGLVADLGVASPQIDTPERGFSYRQDGPLCMQMSPDASLTAEEIVNRWPEKALADLFHRLGEERFARRVARRICERRQERHIRTTLELADIICRAFPPVMRKHHPARKCFQAIRMACNQEAEELQALVEALPSVLAPSGRGVIVAYHSIEDRIVKEAFAAGRQRGCYELLTRKAARPSEAEVAANPRSRSARLRAVRLSQEARE